MKNLLSSNRDCDSSNSTNENLAFVAFSNTYPPNNNINNNSWILRSGISHHITNDASVLYGSSTYIGSNGVLIGNGGKIPIIRIDFFVVSASNSHLRLNHVLHVSSMLAKLISISKLRKDNSVLVEIHYGDFVFKDTLTKIVFLQGLYKLWKKVVFSNSIQNT